MFKIIHVNLFFIGLSVIFTGCSQKLTSQTLSNSIQQAYKVKAHTANKVSPLILENADKYDIPPTLIAAVIQQESSYRATVTSGAGAVGLMQVIPKYWQKKCTGDLYQEHINIHCGSLILSEYYQKSGSWKKALGYYNVGPSGYENNPNSRDKAKKYIQSVEKHETKLKQAL